MTEGTGPAWLGHQNLKDKAGNDVAASTLNDYKLVMIVFTASWWGGCKPFKENLKKYYEEWNATEKQIQVVMVSGDSDEAGYKSSMDGCNWLCVPFKGDSSEIEKKVPCTGYPTPGIVKIDGTVIEADAFGKVSLEALDGWLNKWAKLFWKIRQSFLLFRGFENCTNAVALHLLS